MQGRSGAWLLALFAGSGLGCPTVDLGDTPPDIGQCRPDRAYFDTVIWPQYLAPADINRSCVGRDGCHALEGGRTSLRLDASEPIDLATNYDVVTRFLNCTSPDQSRLLIEPLAGVELHGGGELFANTSDPAVVAFQGWFP